jgi:hypothetical protein
MGPEHQQVNVLMLNCRSENIPYWTLLQQQVMVEIVHPSVLAEGFHLLFRFQPGAVQFPGQGFQRDSIARLRRNCVRHGERRTIPARDGNGIGKRSLGSFREVGGQQDLFEGNTLCLIVCFCKR